MPFNLITAWCIFIFTDITNLKISERKVQFKFLLYSHVSPTFFSWKAEYMNFEFKLPKLVSLRKHESVSLSLSQPQNMDKGRKYIANWHEKLSYEINLWNITTYMELFIRRVIKRMFLMDNVLVVRQSNKSSKCTELRQSFWNYVL